jgi:GT2 family glycosyltransferase
MTELTLSVIIVNWNTRDLLAECIQSLIDTLDGITFDIWVVDNASSDDSLEMLAARYPQVNVIANTENVGFARANNQAMAESQAEFFLLFNSDAVSQPGAIQSMLALAQSQPKAGMVGAHLLNTDGSFQASHTPFPTLWREFLILTGLGRKLIRSHYPSLGPDESDAPQKADYIEGACMLVRRSTYQQVGGLDEGYFMYAEEVDWCRSIKTANWEIWYQPEARIIHHGAGSSTDRRTDREGDLYKSRVRFFRKHYGDRAAVTLKAMIFSLTAVKIVTNRVMYLISRGKRGRAVISLKDLAIKLEGV